MIKCIAEEFPNPVRQQAILQFAKLAVDQAGCSLRIRAELPKSTKKIRERLEKIIMQVSKNHQYKSLIRAPPANVLNIIRGCPFFVLFWASKKEQRINAQHFKKQKAVSQDREG